MDAIVLDNIPFKIDLAQLLRNVHVAAGSDDAGQVRRLAEEASAIARPKALYGVAYVDEKGDDYVVVDGIRFTSRVLRVNLDQVHRVFPYVATCGQELEQWADSLGDMLESFWADAIMIMALRVASSALAAELDERFQPGRTATMNPGSLEDWPMKEQQQLFALLGNPREAIGVALKESFLMMPIKSVSGLRFATEVRFENCQLCPREGCPGRRAPYDAGLYDRRYRR